MSSPLSPRSSSVPTGYYMLDFAIKQRPVHWTTRRLRFRVPLLPKTTEAARTNDWREGESCPCLPNKRLRSVDRRPTGPECGAPWSIREESRVGNREIGSTNQSSRDGKSRSGEKCTSLILSA